MDKVGALTPTEIKEIKAAAAAAAWMAQRQGTYPWDGVFLWDE